MTTALRLGVLGGTFDPIHFGHLDAADAARRALSLEAIRLIPSGHPPHRDGPLASAYHRFALVALAIEGRPGYTVSDLELARSGRSFTVDTLHSLRAEGWPPAQLFFILGADAFADIGAWHQFPDVLDAAHFVVIARPGTTVEDAIGRTPALRPRVQRAGRGLALDAPRVVLVEAHTRAISSTMIRARLAEGAPIDDLVPAAVARHILAHQLYGAVGGVHGKKQSGQDEWGGEDE
jgi:nicotinate-nucleotide adenylyltransferase